MSRKKVAVVMVSTCEKNQIECSSENVGVYIPQQAPLKRMTDSGGGDQVMGFGKHRELTFQEVFDKQPGYCDWALKEREPGGRLKAFVEWLDTQDDHVVAPVITAPLLPPPVARTSYEHKHHQSDTEDEDDFGDDGLAAALAQIEEFERAAAVASLSSSSSAAAASLSSSSFSVSSSSSSSSSWSSSSSSSSGSLRYPLAGFTALTAEERVSMNSHILDLAPPLSSLSGMAIPPFRSRTPAAARKRKPITVPSDSSDSTDSSGGPRKKKRAKKSILKKTKLPNKRKALAHSTAASNASSSSTSSSSSCSSSTPSGGDKPPEKESLDPRFTCKVCMERPSVCVTLPCTHLALCVQCVFGFTEKVLKCVLCRKPVEEVKLLYV